MAISFGTNAVVATEVHCIQITFRSNLMVETEFTLSGGNSILHSRQKYPRFSMATEILNPPILSYPTYPGLSKKMEKFDLYVGCRGHNVTLLLS